MQLMRHPWIRVRTGVYSVSLCIYCCYWSRCSVFLFQHSIVSCCHSQVIPPPPPHTPLLPSSFRVAIPLFLCTPFLCLLTRRTHMRQQRVEAPSPSSGTLYQVDKVKMTSPRSRSPVVTRRRNPLRRSMLRESKREGGEVVKVAQPTLSLSS